MKRINCREAAIEGVITRHGTLVGPLMTELTGFPELTPYGGGWCGNDVFAAALTEEHRQLARRYTQQMGERLRQEGYRGYFELDFLADMDTGEMYLGELNPRVTGASSMTNVTAVAYGDMPLFLFHLLEFMDVDYEIDVDELNAGWAQPSAIDEWSQFILKDTADKVELITEAPRSGIWRLDPAAHGGISLRAPRHRLAHRRRRGRGVLPADRPGGRLPLPGRRHRHPRHARAAADRRPRADGPRPHVDRGDQAASSRPRRCDGAARAWLPIREPGAVLVQDAADGTTCGSATSRRSRSSRRAPRGRRCSSGTGRATATGSCTRARRRARRTRSRCGRCGSTCPSSCPTYERLCRARRAAAISRRASSPCGRRRRTSSGLLAGGLAAGRPGARAATTTTRRSGSRASILHTRWVRAVIGSSDCAWGLLDGINDAGLAVSLAFGGRKVVGSGFGVPLVVRYLLETCDDDRAGPRRPAPSPLPPRAHADDRRRRAATSAPPILVARPRRRAVAQRSSRRTTRGASSGASTRRPPARSSGRSCLAPPARTRLHHARASSSRPSCSRRCTRRDYDRGMGTLYTVRLPRARGPRRVPLAGSHLGAALRGVRGGHPLRASGATACRLM